jgi:hypothetical protein
MNAKAMLVAAAAGGLFLPPMHNWTADLSPLPGHRISGNATFNGDTKDVVKVSLTLENAQPNSTVQWHIHKGACSMTEAPIVGKESDYSPVPSDGSGRVNTTATIPINLNVGGYSIRVHQSGDSANRSQDYYRNQDSTRRDTTMSRDTTMPRDTTVTDTTMRRDSMPTTQREDSTMQRDTSSTSKWQDSTNRTMSSQGQDKNLAACGDLRPQGGEKANRQ